MPYHIDSKIEKIQDGISQALLFPDTTNAQKTLFFLNEMMQAMRGVELKRILRAEYDALGMNDTPTVNNFVSREAVDVLKLTPDMAQEKRDSIFNVALATQRALQTCRGTAHYIKQMCAFSGCSEISKTILAELQYQLSPLFDELLALHTSGTDNFDGTREIEGKINVAIINCVTKKGFAQLPDRDSEKKFLLSMRTHTAALTDRASVVTKYHHKMDVDIPDPQDSEKTITQTINATHISVAHPITELTEKQQTIIAARKEELRMRLAVNPDDLQARIDLAFIDNYSNNNRCLGAQSRKDDAVSGVKNGFVRHVKIDIPGMEPQHMYFTRAATIAYVGSDYELPNGYTRDDLATENLRQVQSVAAKVSGQNVIPHPIVLTTPTGVINKNKETTMQKATLAASQAVSGEGRFSNFPVNEAGMLVSDTVGSGIDLNESRFIEQRAFLGDFESAISSSHPSSHHRTRELLHASQEAVHLALHVALNDGQTIIVPLVMCASGQDRTGGEDEFMCEIFVHDTYLDALLKERNCSEKQKANIKEQIKEQLKDSLQDMRAELFEEAMLATEVVEGSVGQKEDSLMTPDMDPESYASARQAYTLNPNILKANFGGRHVKTNKSAILPKPSKTAGSSETSSQDEQRAASEVDENIASTLREGMIAHLATCREAMKPEVIMMNDLVATYNSLDNPADPGEEEAQQSPIEKFITARLDKASLELEKRKSSFTNTNNPATAQIVHHYIVQLKALQEDLQAKPPSLETSEAVKRLLSLDLACFKQALAISKTKDGTFIQRCLGSNNTSPIMPELAEVAQRQLKDLSPTARAERILACFSEASISAYFVKTCLANPAPEQDWRLSLKQHFLRDDFNPEGLLEEAQTCLTSRKSSEAGVVNSAMSMFGGGQNTQVTSILQQYVNALKNIQAQLSNGTIEPKQAGETALVAQLTFLEEILSASQSKNGDMIQQALGLTSGFELKSGRNFQIQFPKIACITDNITPQERANKLVGIILELKKS